MNYLLTIEYEGTRYEGWQRQKKTTQTIQGKLEQVLSRMTEKEIEIDGAGRTDAGVHAKNQTASVHLAKKWDPKEILQYMNQYLPEDICVKSVEPVSERFHARLWAEGKCYSYRIGTDEQKSVFDRKFRYHLGEALDVEAMRRAAKAGRPVVAHCEVDDLLRGGYIHDGEYCRAHGHKGICSESEWKQVERDIALAEKTGCQYHVCHVSTKESVELVRRAKARGVRVSCETAPHYLLLCDEDLQEDGRFKMNPPLRSREDRAALIAGVADGTIEVIATDHAPHTAEEKSRGLAGSAMGIVGLECAFPLMYKYMVLPGTLTLEKLVALMSDNPRRIFGLGGGLNVGGEADFTVLALGAQYEIDPAAFLSKGRATPFAGWPVQGRAVLTVVGGREAYRDDGLQL